MGGNHRGSTRPVAMLRRSCTRFLALIDFSTPVCIITTERTLPKCWREFNCRVTQALASTAPDPSTNASTIFLHQIPPPNPSTDASTICLFQLPPSCFTNASTKSRQQIPPPTPPQHQSFCLMFRCSLPSRGSCHSSCGAGGWQAQSQSFDGQSRS